MPSIADSISNFIAARGDRLLISAPSGDFTWSDINNLSNQVIGNMGLEPQAPDKQYVVIAWPFDEKFLACVFAAIKIGLPYIPVDQAVVCSEAAVLLGCPESQIAFIGPKILEDLVVESCPQEVPFSSCSSSQPLYGVMTSGTTGAPKIPLIPRRAIELLATAFDDEIIAEGQTWSCIHVPTFGFSTLEYFMPLMLGGQIYVPEGFSTQSGSAAGPLRLVASFKKGAPIDVACITPSGFRVLLSELGLRPAYSLPKYIVLSGEPLSSSLLEQWFALPRQAETKLVSTFASAEAGGQVFWTCLNPHSSPRELGQPLPHVTPYLLDDQQEVIHGPGVGRLAIQSDAIMVACLNDTSQRLINYCLKHSSMVTLLVTDDIIELTAEGRYQFVGRTGPAIKISGKLVDSQLISDLVEKDLPLKEVITKVVDDSSGIPRIVSFGLRSSEKKIEIWPALGEFNQYDRYTYKIMGHDGAISSSFIKAVQSAASHRVVLDVGCGSDLLISRIAASAEAQRVIAYELDPEAAEFAASSLNNSDFQSSIEVVCADVAKIDYPIEADVAVTRIFGNIGSADGVIPVVKAVNKAVEHPITWLPGIVRTKVACVDLPELTSANYFVSLEAETFFQKVERVCQQEYSGRICIRNFDPNRVISGAEDFEVLNLNDNSFLVTRETSLAIHRDGSISGLVLWVQTESDGQPFDNYLESQVGWLPVYLPIFLDAFPVSKADIVRIRVDSKNYALTNPDFDLDLEIVRDGEIVFRTRFASEHQSNRPQTWHRLLDQLRFSSDRSFEQKYLEYQLYRLKQRSSDSQTVPDSVVPLDSFPLTVNGKIDLKQLVSMSCQEGPRGSQVTTTLRHQPALNSDSYSQDEIVNFCQQAFSTVLNCQIGVASNLFQEGASSLDLASIAAMLTTELRRTVTLSMLYDNPTANDLSAVLYRDYFCQAPRVGDITSVTDQVDHSASTVLGHATSAERLDMFDAKYMKDLCSAMAFKGLDLPLKGYQPCFVLSPPRSGSTLLRVLLGTNEHIIAPPELELLRFDSLSSWLQHFSGKHMLWREGLLELIMYQMGVDVKGAEGCIDEWSRLHSSIVDTYAKLFQLKPNLRYVEKSTYYALYPAVLHRIIELFPDCRFIHLFRHPLSCIGSYAKLRLDTYAPIDIKGYSPEQVGELMWIQSHQNILDICEGLGSDRYCRISYNQITGDPGLATDRLCGFLKVPTGFSPQIHDKTDKKLMISGSKSGSMMLGDPTFFQHDSIKQDQDDKWLNNNNYRTSVLTEKLYERMLATS